MDGMWQRAQIVDLANFPDSNPIQLLWDSLEQVQSMKDPPLNPLTRETQRIHYDVPVLDVTGQNVDRCM